MSDSDDVRVGIPQTRDSNGFLLPVSLNTKLACGDHRFRIAIVAVLDSGAKLAAVPLGISARVLSDVTITPEQVVFGTRDLGSVGRETIYLESQTRLPFEVLSSTASSADVAIEKLDSGNTRQGFRLSLQIAKSGSNTATVTFVVRTGSDVQFDIPVLLQYHGVSP